MTTPASRKWRAVPAAVGDLDRLREDDPRLALRAIALLDLIASGALRGVPLKDSPFYGDLSDHYKFYFGLTRNATHRIVYRILPEGSLILIEVIVLEQREEGYVYLLASSRLGRLPESTRNALNRVHQKVIKRRGEQRRNRK